MYVDSNPKMRAVAYRIFSYTGRKYRVEAGESVQCNSHWEGGSRDYYAQVNMETGEYHVFGQSGTMFDRHPVPVVTLDEKTAVIQHTIVSGMDMGITVIVHPSVFPKMLEAGEHELSRDEKIVLVATRTLKSSYAGDGQYRFHEARRVTGIDRDRWEDAKSSLMGKRLLTVAGAITNAGRNLAGHGDLYSLREEQ